MRVPSICVQRWMNWQFQYLLQANEQWEIQFNRFNGRYLSPLYLPLSWMHRYAVTFMDVRVQTERPLFQYETSKLLFATWNSKWKRKHPAKQTDNREGIDAADLAFSWFLCILIVRFWAENIVMTQERVGRPWPMHLGWIQWNEINIWNLRSRWA